MELHALTRHDLGFLAAAVGSDWKLFASMIFGAMVAEHALDIQIHREGPSYVIVMIEVAGNEVVGEDEIPIA